MASIDLGVATGVLATFLGSDPIRVGGTPEQRAYWMGRIADEALLMAYGATEPQAGSDLAAMSTKAVPGAGKRQRHWLQYFRAASSGSATAAWPTSTPFWPWPPAAPSWFVVERGAEGFSHGKPEDKHGIRASNTAALFLEDVYVPADRLIGGVEGQGLAQAQAVFGYTRLMVGAFGLGAGWEALRRAIRYSHERIQGGAPLSEKQGYTHKLIVPNAARLEAARTYIEWVAERLDSGEEGLADRRSRRQVHGHRVGQQGGRGCHPGSRRLRLHQRVHGREDQARRAHHLHLRRHVGDHGMDHRPRPLAATPEDARRVLQRLGRPAGRAARRRTQQRGQLRRAGDARPGRHPGTRRLDRLTRNQHVLFRLGELIAWAETAAVFAERVTAHPTEAIHLDVPTRQALARIHGRNAALKVATDGLQWAIGAGQTDPNLAGSLNLPGIYAAQTGLIDDMNFARDQLNRAF
jgi:alkylation response protein AidB-like acyl-CoA dehydrogenase